MEQRCPVAAGTGEQAGGQTSEQRSIRVGAAGQQRGRPDVRALAVTLMEKHAMHHCKMWTFPDYIQNTTRKIFIIPKRKMD